MSSALWIEDAKTLAHAAERWRSTGLLAFDTEFVFERTFRPRLGLVQVATVDEVALVDPLAVGDLAPLTRVLEDSDTRIAAHAIGGDLVALEPWLSAPIRRLLDTQIAAAFAGFGTSLSYAALVRALEGVELDKHETRTNWLRRPLSPEQLRYAAEDVDHLPALDHKLRERLDQLERLAWAEAESAAIAAAALARVDAGDAWRRVRGIGRLSPRAQRVARALSAWREREAERLDLARPFLMRDPTLLAIAKRGEIDPATVAKLPGYDRHRHERHLDRWRRALEEAVEASADGAGPADDAQDRPPGEREKRIDDRLGELARRRAEELALPLELLLSRRDRERAAAAIANGAEPSAAVGGWRAEALSPGLAELADRP